MKVVVAMSGGVDSSVAAALLRKEGHEVIGVTMQLWPHTPGKDGSDSLGGCCGLEAVEDAAKVARRLGIPHYVLNFRDIFARTVIDDFCHEYHAGRTPNPCIRCNQFIKFGTLLEKAEGLGADYIATGHYARTERDKATGRCLLKKGRDQHKDQSYFLYPATQEQLRRILFPVGDLAKVRVREIARETALPVADRLESQEICFVPEDNYAEFIKEYTPLPSGPGPILDSAGNVLGEHRGIMSYTIGQRRGLGIATTEPLYVTAIEPERNVVVVGTRQQTYASELTASDLNWTTINRLDKTVRVRARLRYRHLEAEATVTPLTTNSVYVKFDEPQMAVTPGQAIVFYDGDIVVGGGTIERKGS